MRLVVGRHGWLSNCDSLDFLWSIHAVRAVIILDSLLIFHLLVKNLSEPAARLRVLHLHLTHELAKRLVMRAVHLVPLSITEVQLAYHGIFNLPRILFLLRDLDNPLTFDLVYGLHHLILGHTLHVPDLLQR